MIKVASPRSMEGNTNSLKETNKFSFFSLIKAFSPVRYFKTQMHEIAWEVMVARAAPLTPMSRAKIKIESRIMLIIAPIRTVYMAVLASPWAVMKAFKDRVTSTNMVPKA